MGRGYGRRVGEKRVRVNGDRKGERERKVVNSGKGRKG
jgi:hypothetical protein